jgi:molybdopterin-guanine dinucleotide biosynthesis protein A
MGFLVAGGKSSRMGSNKAFVDFHSRTLLARALAVLTGACGRAVIVGDPEVFVPYGHTIPDLFPGCGPLAGIHAALLHSPADLNLMLAVDMPFVTEELLHFLLNTAQTTDAIVTIPRIGNGFQPLCAVYRRGFASTAEQALQAGQYRINATFASVPLRVIEESEFVAEGFSERCFFNVNTPEDRRIAEKDFRQ